MIFLFFFASCTNLDYRWNYSDEYKKIDKKLDVWDLKGAEELFEIYQNLNFVERNKLEEKKNLRFEQKFKLNELENFAKEVIYNGNIEQLKIYFNKSLINNIKLNSLENYNYTTARVYFGKREFYKETVNMLMVINYLEENIYINLELKYINGNWRIEKFSERR